MKRFLTVFCLFIFCLSVQAENDRFIEALRNCSSFTDEGIMNVNGIPAKSYKKMTGWQNNRCIYKETVVLGDNQYTNVCKFTKPQIQEITSVADAYYLTLKYSNEEIDTSSVNAVKNNPLFKVLNKYLQNPDVCSLQGQ